MGFRRAAAAAAVAAAALAQGWAFSGAAHAQLLGTDVLLSDARFRAALAAALGAQAREHWIAQLQNSGPVTEVRVGGASYLQATPCKPHDCADNNLLLLYARDSGRVSGVLHAGGRHAPVGHAPPALAAAMETLWKKEFRQP